MLLTRSIVTLSFIIFSIASSVIIANNNNFDDIVYNSGKNSLVEFYASWCGHCKKLEPIYDELSQIYSNSKDVQIVKIECDENRVVCSQFGIKGFPTIKLFKKNTANGVKVDPVEFEGSRNVDSFVKFIGDNVDSYVYIPKIQSNVIQVSDLDFDKTLLNSNKNVFVVFTASWCGHCKNLHPHWEELANIFAHDDDVIIAEVSTTDSPAEDLKERFNIAGFPTILTFAKGSQTPIPFEYSRDLRGLVNWVNEKANKFRDLDGGLLPNAGRINELDDKIVKIWDNSPETINEIITNLLTSLEKFEDSDYYRKLFNKILNGEEEFLSKEFSRINKLLSKSGHLSKDKIDHLQKRLNILKVFQKN